MKNIILSDKLINEENNIKENNDKKGILYLVISCITFGLLQFHIKLTKILFDSTFDSNTFMIWRSIVSALIAYVIIKFNSIKLLSYNEVQNKFWFLVRTFGNYCNILFLVISMTYLRASTVSCISSMCPVIVLVLSVFILKEKLEIRYIVGVIIGFIGTTLIILNERKISLKIESDNKNDITLGSGIIHIIFGTFFGILHMIFGALMNVSQKILAVEKFEVNNLVFYIGLSNFICAIFISLIFGVFNPDWKFALFSSINSFFFNVTTFFLNRGLTYTNLGKLTPIFYLSTVIVFICGLLFLGEEIFLTDIVGSLIIVSFNVYHSSVPIKNK